MFQSYPLWGRKTAFVVENLKSKSKVFKMSLESIVTNLNSEKIVVWLEIFGMKNLK